MRFGICTTIEKNAAARDAGWDFIEESVQGLLQGLEPDERWAGRARAAASALPILSANMLVPAALKVTGPLPPFLPPPQRQRLRWADFRRAEVVRRAIGRSKGFGLPAQAVGRGVTVFTVALDNYFN